MVDRMPRGKSRASLFQSRVLIEELEARQFLTVAPSGQIAAAVRADPSVTTAQKTAHATSPVSAEPSAESDRDEAADSAVQTSTTASRASAVTPDTSNAVASAGNVQSAASSSQVEDDSASVASREGNSDNDTKSKVSDPAESDDAVSPAKAPAASSLKASSVIAESQSTASASPSPAETATSPQEAIREGADSAERLAASILAEQGSASTRGLFNTSLVSERWMDVGSLRSPAGAGNLLSDSTVIGQVIDAGRGLVLEGALFSSKSIINELRVLPGALANLSLGMNGGAASLEAGSLKTAAAPFFYIPRINWVGAVSDAWESFARESLVLPLADSGRVKAWAVTAMVGVADAVLAGYWIRSRNRRKRTFCTGAVADNAVGLSE